MNRDACYYKPQESDLNENIYLHGKLQNGRHLEESESKKENQNNFLASQFL